MLRATAAPARSVHLSHTQRRPLPPAQALRIRRLVAALDDRALAQIVALTSSDETY